MTKRAILRAFAALAALVLAAAPAAAAEWRVIHISPVVAPFGRSLAYVESDTIVREGDEVRFVYDIRFQQDGQIIGLRTPVRASCSTYWFELGGTTSFRDDRQVGESAPTPRQDAERGSNIQLVIEAACTGTFLSEPVEVLTHARAFISAQ